MDPENPCDRNRMDRSWAEQIRNHVKYLRSFYPYDSQSAREEYEDELDWMGPGQWGQFEQIECAIRDSDQRSRAVGEMKLNDVRSIDRLQSYHDLLMALFDTDDDDVKPLAQHPSDADAGPSNIEEPRQPNVVPKLNRSGTDENETQRQSIMHQRAISTDFVDDVDSEENDESN